MAISFLTSDENVTCNNAFSGHILNKRENKGYGQYIIGVYSTSGKLHFSTANKTKIG